MINFFYFFFIGENDEKAVFRKSIGEQQGGAKSKGRKSGNKYDVFRQNCGFLTDTDQVLICLLSR